MIRARIFQSMSDTRTLLKNGQTTRRITHKYASYSTIGALLCTACRLQIKNESSWDRHLQSVGHLLHANKSEDILKETIPVIENLSDGYINEKKRKAVDDCNNYEIRKRSKPPSGEHAEDSFSSPSESLSINSLNETCMTSRPATPSSRTASSAPVVDEHEWAAFEADIAAAEIFNPFSQTYISAPAMTVEDVKKKSAEEEYVYKKERQEAEIEGDKEDVARKMEEELDNMEKLEARLRRLQAKREELRQKQSIQSSVEQRNSAIPASHTNQNENVSDEDEDEDFNDFDEWDAFEVRT